jgi:hypothetical protein
LKSRSINGNIISNYSWEEVGLLTRLTVAAVCVSLLAFATGADAIIVEAESYVASNNIGGTAIYVTACAGASGGRAVEGFDTPGEWIEVVLDVPGAGSYADSIRSAGRLDFESDLGSTIFGGGPGGIDITSSYHTIGLGIG